MNYRNRLSRRLSEFGCQRWAAMVASTQELSVCCLCLYLFMSVLWESVAHIAQHNDFFDFFEDYLLSIMNISMISLFLSFVYLVDSWPFDDPNRVIWIKILDSLLFNESTIISESIVDCYSVGFVFSLRGNQKFVVVIDQWSLISDIGLSCETID